ncbi:MAG TPA: MBL fold metallo-hydrolase [Myxococcales bacterium]|nr:MBL fold metallo-hydrolase [Myxococcales bacterium]
MPQSEVEIVGGAIHLSGSALWFDAPKRQPLSFVSHAHGDHIARHERVIATGATARLMERRLGKLANTLTAPYGQSFDLGPLKLTLFPAGHILGSAQILVERGGRRIVYTGDLCLSPSLTAEAATVVPCDVLVIEATFGHPRYRLPRRPEALARVEEFVQRTHAGGGTPVLLAYALGKSQEVIRYLGERGFAIRADDTICALAQVYRDSGCPLPEVARYRGVVAPGEVLVVPPHRVRAPSLRRLPRRRTAILTGWALDGDGARRYRADEAIPLSDHADFDQLVDYVERSGAKQVYTVHGFCQPLADELRARGFRARPLDRGLQLDLFE